MTNQAKPPSPLCPLCGTAHDWAHTRCPGQVPEPGDRIVWPEQGKVVTIPVGPTETIDLGASSIDALRPVTEVATVQLPPGMAHPGPWRRWSDKYGDEGGDAELCDARGVPILEAACSTEDIPAGVRALTEAAPEMEALLRALVVDLQKSGASPMRQVWLNRISPLLARIDDRSKGGG